MAKKSTNSAGKLPGKATITKHLRELAASLSDQIDESGHALTKSQALAKVIWDRALGWTEILDAGAEKKHAPEPWAITLIYDRTEGRCPTALDVGSNKGTVADKVSELGRTKINDLTPEESQPEEASGDE